MINAYYPYSGAVGFSEDISGHVINCVFIDNTAINRGGAISIYSGNQLIQDCVFIGNQALKGGAVSKDHGGLVMENCVFIGNASDNGGAMHLNSPYGGSMTHCTFYDNAAAQGGAVSIETPLAEPFVIHGCILAGSATGEGLYWNGGGVLTVTHSDIYGNAGGDWTGTIADQLGVEGNIQLDPQFCEADTGNLGLWNSSPCLAQNNPGAVQMGAFGMGCTVADAPPPAQAAFALYSYPNPCNPQATISFSLGRPQPVRVDVFALDGRRVARLADRVFGAGDQLLTWNGRDAGGNAVASGTYVIQLTATDGTAREKIMLLK